MKNVEIKDIGGEGKGIFALRNLKKDKKILKITGKVIETEEPSKYPEEIREHWGPLGRKGRFYRFIHPEPPWMYMNHSCNSNAGIINDRTLIASKDIKKAEEVTIDYSTIDIESITEGKKVLSMRCKCGSKTCRKIVRTFDKLNKKDQKRLEIFLNSYMRKRFL